LRVPSEIILTRSGVPPGGASKSSSRDRGCHTPRSLGAESMRLALDVFGRPEFRPKKSPPRPTTARRCSGACLRRCARQRRTICPAQRRGPERMGLTLDILEGQNFARKNHHGVGPRRAISSRIVNRERLDGFADRFLCSFRHLHSPPVNSCDRAVCFRLPASSYFLRKMLLDHLGELRLHPGLERSAVMINAKRRRGYSPACSSSTPSKSSSQDQGRPPVRSACTWRSMFTRVRASPFSTTTASSHVVHVQRSLPSSARSAVI
jgi:hypothetical protein